ncbi:MAG: AI-2E family transporter [Alcaligenaceae bacterium]|nr:AI-2E family transporter [Alcaligenaceae bacterium]
MNEKNLRRNQTLLWSGVGIGLLILLYILSPVLTPFMLAMALAYILAPGVQLLVRLHLPRWLAVSIMIFILFAVILGIMLIVFPLLRREVNLVIEQMPLWVYQYNTNMAPLLDEWFGVDSKLDIIRIRQMLQDAVTGTDSLFTTAVNYLKASGSTFIFFIASAMLTPVVLVYLLFDWHTFLARFIEVIPRRFLESTLSIGNEIDKLLSSFLRGQILVMIILAAFYSIGLSIAGFDSAIPIGVITGLLVFIPYLGFGLGLLLAILSALLQFDGYYGLISVAIVFGIGQIFESLYLTPKIMGDRIGLHPLVIIFALFVFGEIFGFFGVLLALPISAALSVLIRRVYGQYRNSTFYTNE